MEIKTSSQIEKHLNSIDTLNPKYDDYFEAYSNAKWVDIKDVIDFCNSWFDKKRKNNEMWRLNQDELSSLFLDELENELKKEE